MHLSIKSCSVVHSCPDPFTLLAHNFRRTYLRYTISEYEFSLPVEFTGNFVHGKMLMLEYLEVPYSVLYCFWFILMIWQKAKAKLNAKLLPDDTLLFYVIHDFQNYANNLNIYLEIISNWATQWKMNFNPDTTEKV